ncbi:hypothetical protein AG0111_0g505 [Alternaria gaisen]|uniref:Uncharacterized protein n=1 Tax=Alternaria gaisen TaxID=167740 RepID=A0ACB6G1Z6_9PLEO|nr:hypothetical protein AG0111_0g505 [Alternaria gaisen]
MPPLSLEVKGSLETLPFTMALTQERAVYKFSDLTVVVGESPHSQLLHIGLQRSHQGDSQHPHQMGRGAYDTTYVCNEKDSAAAVAIAMHSAKAAEAAKVAAVKAAEAAEAKLVRSKKSRGILAARKAAREQAAVQTDTYASEGDSDTTEKP